MADVPKVIKTVVSGFPEHVGEVIFYDTVIAKIRENHPEEHSRLPEIIETIEGKATRIHKSKTHRTSICLINDNVVSNSGDPLRIPIKTYPNGPGIMTSAYFTSSNNEGELLWGTEPPKKNKPKSKKK